MKHTIQFPFISFSLPAASAFVCFPYIFVGSHLYVTKSIGKVQIVGNDDFSLEIK